MFALLVDQERVRGKNQNALEWIERQEVRITGDDMRRAAAHREFKELVILGVTASCNLYIHIDPLSFARQSRQKDANVFVIDIPAELFSAQNFRDLGEGRKRKEQLSLSERQVKSLARLRIRQEQGTDQDVRIEDAAQLCALQQRIQRLRSEPLGLGLASDLIEHLL